MSESTFAISNSQATWEEDQTTAVARFTMSETAPQAEGGSTRSRTSVEVKLEFDQATKTWKVQSLRQWEGRF